MSHSRAAVVIVLVALFVAVGGALVYRNQPHGGRAVTLAATVTKASSMSPGTLNANLNDDVTINLTSDTDGEVHLHGYDIAFECTAGQVTSKTFKADKSGQFDIEWESTSSHLGTLVVT